MTREEAIKVIRDNWPEGRVILQEALKTLVPELKESKDERIKRCIGMCLTDATEQRFEEFNTTIKDCLAWLEKQGEKIDVIENFDTEFEKQVSHLVASIINKEHEYNEGFVKWTANALLNYAKHELEKKELKKIEPFKQKLAWSEEDKNMLQNILECLKNGWSKLPTDILKYESWLKSIKERYTWRPSDEQMEALYTYIYNPQYFNSPDPRMELVESVYKDLKKLKEE